MRTFVGLLLAAALSLPFTHPVRGQTAPQQGPQGQDDEVLRIRSNEVQLDVVVKDKKGRPIKDLKNTDFEIYEDGKPQRIESFRFVMREGAAGGGEGSDAKANRGEGQAPGAAPARASATTPGIVALVFDRLSPEARSLARKAGMAYAQQGMSGGDYTGVFGIDQSLRTIQPFTDNPELVKQAIEQATGATTSTYASEAGKVRDMADRGAALERQMDAMAAAAAASGPGSGDPATGNFFQVATEQKFIEMQTSMIEQYQLLERDQQGFATINSLLAVINPMRRLPGRKTLILFSEGLALPPAVQAKFPSVISAANRANVSIYAIDAAGLRIEAGTAEAAREINSLASRRMQQVGRGSDTGTNGPYTRALEKNEDLLRLDPRGGLGDLAEETGGFLIHDTNDLSSGVRRITDDMRGYYMITYVPQNTEYDGRFRQISVKLSQANYDVQTRRGYYAVESLGQLPVLDFEAPALAAAHNARPAGDSSPFRAGVLSFPATNRAGLALVLAEMPLSAFTFAQGSDKKSYKADFSIVGLIRNQAGQVVQKLSQHYPLSGPAENLDAAKKGSLLFYRETQLPPGRYTSELIAYDAATGQASVRTGPLEIPAADAGKPRLSSLVVIKRGERLTAAEQKRDQPLHFGELLIYPNLGEPIVKSASNQLAFFFTAWPAAGSAAAPQVTVEIMQNRRRLGHRSGQLPAPDEQGQIKYASSIPLDKFDPGVYELKVTVGEGANSVSRSMSFTVAP